MDSNNDNERASIVVVLCTAPSEEEASRLAKGLVEARLAACVAVLPAVRSFFRWEGKLEEANEYQLLIKCPRARSPDVASWLVANHPYDVPEVVVLPVLGGNAQYLSWVEQSCAD